VEPAQALVQVAVSAQVPTGVVSLARAQVLAVAAVPMPALVQGRVLAASLLVKERGRRAE
jgi:hypothetical protein